MSTDRFDAFAVAELQTIYLGLSRLRDSRWFAETESFLRLQGELADALGQQRGRRSDDIASELVALVD